MPPGWEGGIEISIHGRRHAHNKIHEYTVLTAPPTPPQSLCKVQSMHAEHMFGTMAQSSGSVAIQSYNKAGQ